MQPKALNLHNMIYGLDACSHVIIFKKSLGSHRPVARPYELEEIEIFLKIAL
jgi:hypothetical protein